MALNISQDPRPFKEIMGEQERNFADQADYLLEQFGCALGDCRAPVMEGLDASEKNDMIEGLLKQIGSVAMNCSFTTGQQTFNRAFHLALGYNNEDLAAHVDREAVKYDFAAPSTISLEA